MFFSCIGRQFIVLNRALGSFSIFVLSVIGALFFCLLSFRRNFYLSQLVKFLFQDIVFSLFVVALTSSVIGYILVLQIYGGVTDQYVELVLAKIVTLSITRDLAPVFMGFLLAGRIGTAFTSKLSSMKLTEQLEAFETLTISAVHYLILPKVLSSVLTFSIIYCFSIIFGVFGSYVAVSSLGLNLFLYLSKTYDFLCVDNIMLGLMKSAVFGLIIAFVSCYSGLNAERSSKGVGEASTKAIVSSIVWILIINSVFNLVFLNAG